MDLTTTDDIKQGENLPSVKKSGGQPPRKAFTKAKKKKFIKHLSETCNVQQAAKLAGINYKNAYYHKLHDLEFAEQWKMAVSEAVDELEGSVWRRATHGAEKPVFYQGIQCGTTQEYSDTLAALLLKAHKPDLYGDKRAVELSGPNRGPIEINQVRGRLLEMLEITDVD